LLLFTGRIAIVEKKSSNRIDLILIEEHIFSMLKLLKSPKQLNLMIKRSLFLKRIRIKDVAVVRLFLTVHAAVMEMSI
jgi:hypothetical protein